MSLADDAAVQAKFTADFSDLQAGSAQAAALVESTAAQMQTGYAGAAEGAAALEAQAVAAAESLTATAAASEKSSGDLGLFAGAAKLASDAMQAFGVANGGAAIVAAGEDALNYAASIQHTADMLGMTTDEVQAFQFAARQAGVDTDTADMALRNFMAGMGQLQEGTGPAAAAVKQFGLTADELDGDPFAALQKVAQAILGMKDAAAQANVERELFGRGGQELDAILERLAGGFDDLKQKASDAGAMLDPKVAKAALQSEVALANFFTMLKGDGATAIVGIGQDIQGLIDLFGSLAKTVAFSWSPFIAGVGAATTAEKNAAAGFPAPTGAMAPPMRTPQMADAGNGPKINIVDEKQAQEQASRAAEIARRLSDEIAQDAEQLSLKQISATEQANNFELQMGDESLDQWKATADKAADDKLTAELKYLNAKAAADKNDVVAERKDQDEIAAAYQEHKNALAAIDQQYAEKLRAQNQAELQDKIQADNAEYSNTVSRLNVEVKDHQLSASQRAQAEISLATTVEQNELAMFDATHQGLVAGTTAFDQAMKQRQAIVDAFSHRVETANDQLASEESQTWNQLGNSIKSSFNSAIDGMLFQGKTFEQGMLTIAEGVLKAFLSMAENIAENWIEQQIATLFETKATQGTTALGEVSDAAGVAGANAYAAYAAVPPVAAAMAADAVAATMGFASLISLDVGAWDLKNDTLAQLHKGEMVVPQNFAEGLRSSRGLGGGETHFNTNYSPSISARDPTSIRELIRNNHTEFVGEIRRLVRNGALR